MRNFFTVLDFETRQVKIATSSGDSRIPVDIDKANLVVIVCASVGSALFMFIIFCVAYKCCRMKRTQDEEDLLRSTSMY